MDNNIQNIFNKNKTLLNGYEYTIYYLRKQNFYRALGMLSYYPTILASFIDELVENKNYFNDEFKLIDVTLINQLLVNIMEVQNDKDWVLLADILEVRLINFLLSVQEKIVLKEKLLIDEEKYKNTISLTREVDEELAIELENSTIIQDLFNSGYSVEYTSTGKYTLKIIKNNKGMYLHSNNQIDRESLLLADAWHQEGILEYIVYGLGLFHHIYGLYQVVSNAEVKVTVYESDINIIKLACAYSDIDLFLKYPNFELVYDPKFDKLVDKVQSMNDESKLVIHYPSLYNIKEDKMRERMEDCYIKYSSFQEQSKYLRSNFLNNIKYNNPSVEILEKEFKGKDLYIIAAGPSLDNNFMQLKNIKHGIILTVGKAFKKLYNAGVRPDYVIVTDSSPHLNWQVEGLEETGIPLIYLSTACKKIIKEYKADKYTVFQKGYDLSEGEAEKRNCKTFNTGGSVSTTALDIGIELKCSRIIFLGLDLSYPNNMSHAEGIRSVKIDNHDLRKVTTVSGGTVYTNKPMDMYRRWIENRISGLDEPEFINATEGGAYIRGMKHMTLQEVIG